MAMNELPLYQIANWNQHFENNKSRQRDKCGFVALPNKHGGQGLTAVLNSGPGIEGNAMYGTWVLLVGYLSRQPAPREGFLTADGTRNGMRLCAAELARMCKCPTAHIRNTLRVVCSIGWMRLVEGAPELPDQVTAATVTDSDAGSDRASDANSDTLTSDASEQPPVTAEVTAATVTDSDAGSDRASDANSVLSRDTERKKERMKEPLPSPKGTETNGHRDLSIPDLQAWFNSLFGRQRAWSYEELQLLSDLWPVEKKDRALLSWAYKLPRDRDGWLLVDGRQASKPKENLIGLLREFASEIDKWRGVRARKSPVLAPVQNEPLPPKWEKAIKKLYGEDTPIPHSKHLLAPSARQEIEAAVKEAAA